jgi:hypothetical protein
MEINFNLYNIIHLQNGNILLELKKAVEKEYNLILTDTSFYSACEKNIGKINIYEPTTLTPKLLKIIMDEGAKIESWNELLEKINWIQENMSATELGERYNSYIDFYMEEIEVRIDYFMKNNESKIKSTTLVYLFTKLIAQISGHYTSFGEEFFLLKLINQYFPDIRWDYEQIYIFETRNDIDTECSEHGGKFHELVTRLCKGDKTAFDGKEIEFFPSSFEKNKMNISQEIFSYIQHDLDNDGINWKDYDPRSS